MKIGDQFKHQAFQQVWRLTRDNEGNKIRLLALPEMEIYGPGVITKSYDSLDETEFCELMDTKESIGYVNLDGTPLFPAETYQCGEVFEVVADPLFNSNIGDKLMLCQVGYNKYCLVTVTGHGRGNRWADPIEPKDIMAITKEELKQMLGSAQAIVLKKVNE